MLARKSYIFIIITRLHFVFITIGSQNSEAGFRGNNLSPAHSVRAKIHPLFKHGPIFLFLFPSFRVCIYYLD